jgi:predicted nucleotide-binding protein
MRIERLQDCVRALSEFDPQNVQRRYNIPEVEKLEASIKGALAAAFGDGTPAYNRYRHATSLDNGPRFARTGAFGRGRQIDYDAREAQEARQYLADGKKQSIGLLEDAIRALEYEIADQEPRGIPAALPLAIQSPEPSRKIFLVHGRDDAAKNEVALFLRGIGLEPIILHLRPNGGRHLLTKFAEESEGASFAVVLMTPDDEGGLSGTDDWRPRARQNVVFELGFFIGKLGAARVAALLKGDVEKPSDFDGIAYIGLDPNSRWKTDLARELHHARVPFDPANAFTA